MVSLVLISGEEDFLINRAAGDEARLALAQEILEYEFPDDLEKYLRESSAGFESSKRAYIVRNPKEIPVLPASLDDVLIIVTKKPISDKRAKRVLSYPKLKTFSDNNEVVRWTLKEGERFNIDLSRIAGALFVNSGNCLRKISSEVQKISAAVPPGSIVSPEQARPLMCFSAELTPREIINAICDGNTIRALAFYDRLQERTDETGWIIAYLQRHIIQQLRLERLLETKASDDKIASELGVHPFILKKMIFSRRGLWPVSDLVLSLNILCDLDIAHKRGSESAHLGLETEIIRLSEIARDVKR